MMISVCFKHTLFLNATGAQGKITKHSGDGGREEGQTDIRKGLCEEEPSQLDNGRGCQGL